MAQVAQRALAGVIGAPFSAVGGLQVFQPSQIGPNIGNVPSKIDDILIGTDQRYTAATSRVTFLNPSNVATNLLPTGYRHLLIEWYARIDGVGPNAIEVLANNDSGAHYNYNNIRGTNAAVSVGGTQVNATFMALGNLPGTAATTGYFGVGECKIFHYNGAVGNKQFLAHSIEMTGNVAGNELIEVYSGIWQTVGTPITRLDLISGSGNFIVGSLFTLWGIP